MNILVKANKSFDVENMFQSNAAISLFRFSKNGGMMSYINRSENKILPNVKFVLNKDEANYIGICLSKFDKVNNITVHYPLHLIDNWESDIEFTINDNLIEELPLGGKWSQKLIIEDFI